MKFVLRVFAVLTLLTAVRAGCANYQGNSNCPQDSPCCNGGWCSNNPRFCSTGCEPENSFSLKSCYPTPYCVNQYDDFSTPRLVNDANFSGNPNTDWWTSDFTPDYAGYTTDGNLYLGLHYDGTKKNPQGNYQGFGATVSSSRWMQYGTVSARIKTASNSLGVVSSFITKNLVGDEIDYEWVGLSPNMVQSNYYWLGVLDYTHSAHHQVGDDASANYHIYTIQWLPDSITWSIDGTAVRTVTQASTQASNGTFKYPSGPSRIEFSVWDGGMGLDGTVQWAGGPTNWTDQSHVYMMYVDWVNITCYYQGNSTGTWPPDGYGPTNTTSSNGAYTTLGNGTVVLNNGNGNGYGGSGQAGDIDGGGYNATVPPPPSGSFATLNADPLSAGLFTLLVVSMTTSIMFTFKNGGL